MKETMLIIGTILVMYGIHKVIQSSDELKESKIELKRTIFHSGYLHGVHNVLNNGEYDETVWKNDSLQIEKIFNK